MVYMQLYKATEHYIINISSFKIFFSEQFQVYNKIKGKVQRFPHTPPVPHMHSFLHFQYYSPEWYIFPPKDELTLKQHNYPKLAVYPWFTLSVLSMDLDKWTMINIHYNNIIQSVFTALNILCALLLHLFIPL